MDTQEDEFKGPDKESLRDELTAICNNLGKLDENDGTYMKDRDCKPCLKEIQRFLSIETKEHVARLTLGAYNVIKTDLIPLMVQYCDYNDGDQDLFNTILRLCINLTSPVDLLFDDKEIVENEDKLDRFKLESNLLKCLCCYKEAFSQDDQFWSLLNTYLRHELENEIMFERIILLIRNILHIPVDTTEGLGIDIGLDSHDICLSRMDKSGLLDTILQICSESQKGLEFSFHMLEIIYLMLRDQSPEVISKAEHAKFRKTLQDTDVDKQRLKELSERNKRARQQETTNLTQYRLKGSSFIVQNVRSISDKPLVLNKPLIATREDIQFGRGKTELRKPKNKRPLSSETSMRISDKTTKKSKISYSLQIFCKQFIEKIYNNFMQHIKYNLIQKKTQDHDETYYLWAIQFFSAFSRFLKLDLDLIKETLSMSTIHYIQVLIITYQDKIKIEKKDFANTSRRLHLAARATRELLILIKDNENYKGLRKSICSELEYSLLLLTLLQEYEESKHSVHYLNDLIHTNYIFLETYEKTTTESMSMFMNRYSSPNVIKAHLSALKNFKSNETEVNLSILKLFQRIAIDCDASLLLCQASLFQVLLEIINNLTQFPYLIDFKSLAIHIFGAFGRAANKKRWMFQETLFWTSATELIEIEHAIDPPPPIPDPEIDPPPVTEPEMDVPDVPDLSQMMWSPSPEDHHARTTTPVNEQERAASSVDEQEVSTSLVDEPERSNSPAELVNFLAEMDEQENAPSTLHEPEKSASSSDELERAALSQDEPEKTDSPVDLINFLAEMSSDI